VCCLNSANQVVERFLQGLLYIRRGTRPELEPYFSSSRLSAEWIPGPVIARAAHCTTSCTGLWPQARHITWALLRIGG
jgi:hypothetical protein